MSKVCQSLMDLKNRSLFQCFLFTHSLQNCIRTFQNNLGLIRDLCHFDDIGKPRFHAKLFKYKQLPTPVKYRKLPKVTFTFPCRHKTSSRHLKIVLELSYVDTTFSRYLQDIFIKMTCNRHFQDILILSQNRLIQTREFREVLIMFP